MLHGTGFSYLTSNNICANLGADGGGQMDDFPNYDFPVFATQGGGLARRLDKSETFVFVESPEDFPELKEGDSVPAEWDLVPVNAEAQQLVSKDQFGDGMIELPIGMAIEALSLQVKKLKQELDAK